MRLPLPARWGIAMLGLALIACSFSLPGTVATQPPPTALPPAASLTPTIQPAATVAAPVVIIGEVYPVSRVSADWLSYDNPVMGLSLRHPPGWQVVEEPWRVGVRLVPPGFDPDLPGPLISLVFIADHPYTGVPLIETGDMPEFVAIQGLIGIRYIDVTYAIPVQSAYIELPYRGGTLWIKATLGPRDNLYPQLDEILQTLELPGGE